MRAAILKEPGRFEIESRPAPEPGPGQVRIRAHVCGICTGELDQYAGHVSGLEYPRFIGHEVSGVVEALGPNVNSVREGDRVTVYAEGGGYAEQVVVPAEWVVPLKQDTPFEHALGEPVACSVNGVRKADPELGASVCIVGCGFMGLVMLQVFKARGAGRVIAVDRRASVLELAARLGADETLDSGRTDVEEAVREMTDGNGVDIGVEAAGVQPTLDLTARLVRMEGKLVVFGFHVGGTREVDWAHWNWMAFDIINGHSRNPETYVEGIRIGMGLLEAGKLQMDSLVTHEFDLDDINTGFECAVQKDDGFVKGIIRTS